MESIGSKLVKPFWIYINRRYQIPPYYKIVIHPHLSFHHHLKTKSTKEREMWKVGLRAFLMLYTGLAPAAALPAPEEEQPADAREVGAGGDIWFEEEIDSYVKLSYAINGVLHSSTSEYQLVELIDTKHFGKVLVIDGKVQSAESDEFIYHELLVHPPLLHHPNPKRVFIMGGGEGSTAREVLNHKSVEKVVMCDIDSVVVDFCRSHLSSNALAFTDPRLQILINDAKAELEKTTEDKFDVIVGDLADPLDGGPCNQLYTKSFYEGVVKPRLNPNGIFVTQAGPGGVPASHKIVFTSIYNTLKQVFKFVVPYTTHIPSYMDTWGWIIASDEPLRLDVKEIDKRIGERLKTAPLYFDGSSFMASTVMNKIVRKS
ncbi:Thermospermine synthase ACAULIS5 [Linum grandiflorum]